MKIVIALLLVILFPFSRVSASALPQIYISEVGAYEKDGYEWVEVTTISTTTNFSNYKLYENETGHGLTDFLGSGEVIPPMSKIIIAQNAEDVIGKYGDQIEYLFDSSWGNLKLSGEEIGILGPDGTMLDTFTYTESSSSSVERYFENGDLTMKLNPFGNSIGKDYEFVEKNLTITNDLVTSTNEILEQDKSNNTTSTIEGHPLDDVNSTSTAHTPHRSDLIINEFLYRPKSGEPEWVEIKNTSKFTLSLNGLEVHDGNGSIGVMSEDILRVGETALLTLPSHKLNNLGDEIKLIYRGEVISSLSYGEWAVESIDYVTPEAEIGESIALFDGHYLRTLENTPNKENILLSRIEEQEKVVYKESVIIVKSESGAESSSVPSSNNTNFVASPETTLEPGTLMITTVYPSPQKEEMEYLEIKNLSNSEVDLGKIYLADKSKAKTTFLEKLQPGETKKVFSPRGNLNNGGDTITILNTSDDTIIDQISYGDTPNGEILRRKNFEQGEILYTENNNLKELYENASKEEKISEKNVTSTKQNSLLKQESFDVGGGVDPVLDLVISEIFPNPKGTDQEEFIEIYNPTEKSIDVGGILLDDAEGGSKPYKFKEGTIVKPGEFLLVEKVESKISLNNTSDSVRILFVDGSVILEVVYDDVEEGKSFVEYDNGVWVWTTLVTPGTKNLFVEKTDKETVSLVSDTPSELKIKKGNKYPVEDAAKAEEGEEIEVSGVVVATSGMIGMRYIQIVSDTPGVLSGVQVYLHSNNFPKMGIGDIVSVYGEVSKKENYTRIKVDSEEKIKVLASAEPPETVEVSWDDVDNKTVGALIKIKGKIVNKTSQRLTIKNMDQQITVKPYNYDKFKMENFSVGQNIVASGVLQKSASEIFIVPRSMGDLIIEETNYDQQNTGTQKIKTETSSQELMEPKGLIEKQKKDRYILELILVAIILFLLYKKNSSK